MTSLRDEVLEAVRALEPRAYCVNVMDRVSERRNVDISYGAIWMTLARLEEAGVLRSWVGEPTPVRGGRAKRFYEEVE